jgi:hypothetical protein
MEQCSPFLAELKKAVDLKSNVHACVPLLVLVKLQVRRIFSGQRRQLNNTSNQGAFVGTI